MDGGKRKGSVHGVLPRLAVGTNPVLIGPHPKNMAWDSLKLVEMLTPYTCALVLQDAYFLRYCIWYNEFLAELK